MNQSHEQQARSFEILILNDRELRTEVAQKAQKIFKLDSKGNVIFQIPRGLLSVEQLTAVYLLAQYIGNQSQLKDSAALTAEALGELTGARYFAPDTLGHLQQQGLVESVVMPLIPSSKQPEEEPEKDADEFPDVGDRITLAGANKILDDIDASIIAWERKHYYPFYWQDRNHNRIPA
jgi:hypothetical protein